MRDGSPTTVVDSGKKRKKRKRAPRYSSRKQIERARMRRERSRERRFSDISDIRRTLTPSFVALPVETYSRRGRLTVPAVMCDLETIAPLEAQLSRRRPQLNIEVQGESRLRDQSLEGHSRCNIDHDIQVRLQS